MPNKKIKKVAISFSICYNISEIRKGEIKMRKNNNQLMVVKGRHRIINNQKQEITDFVFDEIVDVRNIDEMQAIADSKIASISSNRVHLYITGLTVAVITVINAVIKYNKEIVFWHYDRETETYYPQRLEEFLKI